jgi:plastocyanin
MKIIFALLGLVALSAYAADREFPVVIRDHRFEPAEIRVPAGQKIKLVITNRDSTPEEFESQNPKREKVIAPGATARINLGPLAPGKYPFVGEFHEDSARGVIVAE